MIRTGLIASLSIVLLAAPAFAADVETSTIQINAPLSIDSIDAVTAIRESLPISASLPLGASLPRDTSRPFGADLQASRGPVLLMLYGTLGGLQAYDGWSTVKAVRLGATEANPAVSGLARNANAMWAVKAGATMVSIYAAERLWRQHRRAEAILTMIAVNGVMAGVAVHNVSVMQGLK